MEVLGCRGFVEIQIATENLVGTLTAEYHLDTHRLDDTGQQIHGRGGTDGGDVVGLDIVDDIANGVKTFLNGVVDFVVHGTDVVGHQLGLGQVGSTLQTNGKGVQTGPIGFGLRVILDAVLREFLGDGRDDGGIESARKQHTIGHIGHELALNSSGQSVSDSLNTCRIVLHGFILHPVTTVVPLHSWVYAPVIMTWQERLVALTLSFEGF